MKKKILLSILLLIFQACGESQCIDFHKLVLKQHCNLIVERNYNTEERSFSLSTLKLEGLNIETKKSEIFHPETRGWRPYTKHIAISDTVVKKQGEAIMRIYKKDSIITISYEDFCDKTKFNQDNVLKIIVRDSIGK